MAKVSLTRGKAIFIVDLSLVPIFILIIYSGLRIHIAGNTNDYNHDVWSYWAHFHIIVSAISLFVGWLHIKAHWGWYKSLINKGIGKKSKTTLSLSVLFLLLTITGIILMFFVEGGNSIIGLLHYKLGLIMIPLLIIHLVTRFHLIVKALKKKSDKRKD